MSNNLIAYWRNWNDEDVNIPITSDGYIFKYTISHQVSNHGNYEWVCCKSIKKLYSFIKYFILPSIQLSRTIGVKENTVCIDVVDYEDTILYLNNPNLDNYTEHVETYKRWFDEIDKLEKKEASIDELREYIDKINLEIDYNEYIYVELELFEDISSLGNALIANYEEDGFLDILEVELKMSKDNILELFNNIDSNKFMLKKITDILTGILTEKI